MYGAPVPKDLSLQVHPAASVRTPPQMSSPGLLRYRSAPSTLLGDVCGDFLPAAGAGAGHRPASPDNSADNVLARFLAGHHHEIREKPPRPAAAPAPHFQEHASSMASQQLMYQSQQQQQQQQMAAMEGLYRTTSSGAGADPASGNSLLRQSSSPAGFLNHLNMDNGYGNMLRAGMGGGGGGYRNGDARLKGQLSFSSRQGSVMSQISEMVSEEMEDGSSPEAGSNGAARGGGGAYGSGIPAGYPMGGASSGWEEHTSPSPSPSLLSVDSLSNKRPRDAAPAAAAASDVPSAPPRLMKQQYSLPSSKQASPEMAAIERFLQFQDAVPCKIRAKRGCATHPRSIAERVRRTKISERIRRLQELVPNMEKQTNTSDMLDLAVDYIKELQMQVKVLNDGRSSCTCSASRQTKHFAG